MSASLAAQIATWASGLRHADLPPAAAALAKRAILDTAGCALAGAGEPCAGSRCGRWRWRNPPAPPGAP